MRWPFGPPHLTLKPSKKHPPKKQTPQKRQERKNNKKKQKPKKKTHTHTKTTKTELFSYQSKFSFYFGGCPTFPFFDNLAQKARTQKITIKIGVSARFF